VKIPVIDLAECVDCDACLELCPTVFRRNEGGYIQVIDLLEYPAQDVDECIKNCPADCIAWEEL